MAPIKKPSCTTSLIIACFVLLISTTVSNANRLLKGAELEEALPRAAARELVQGAAYGSGSGSQYGSGSGGSTPSGASSSGTDCYGGGVIIGGGCGITCGGCGTVSGGGGVVIEIPGVQIPGITIPGGTIGVGCGGSQGGCSGSGGSSGSYSGPSCGSGGSSGGQQVGYPCPIYVPVPVIGGGCPQQPIGGGCVVTPVPGYPGCGQDEPNKEGKGLKKMAVAMAPEPMDVDQLIN